MLAILLGCGRPLDLVGTWQGRIAIENRDSVPDYMRNSMERVNLVVTQEGTFSLTRMGITVTGNVESGNRLATLVPDLILGRPVTSVGPDMKRFVEKIVVRESNGKFEIEWTGDGAKTSLVRLSRENRKID